MRSNRTLRDFIETLHPLALEAIESEFGEAWREDIKALARVIEYDEILRESENAEQLHLSF